MFRRQVQYSALTRPRRRFTIGLSVLLLVLGEVFQPQNYGIALPSGSPERELVNQALLEIIEDGTYDQIYRRWFSAFGTG